MEAGVRPELSNLRVVFDRFRSNPEWSTISNLDPTNKGHVYCVGWFDNVSERGVLLPGLHLPL